MNCFNFAGTLILSEAKVGPYKYGRPALNGYR